MDEILTVPFTKFFRWPGSLYVKGTTTPAARYASMSSWKYSLRPKPFWEYSLSGQVLSATDLKGQTI